LEEVEAPSRSTLQHHKGIGLQSVKLLWFGLVLLLLLVLFLLLFEALSRNFQVYV
jgi:hypothetical protein